MKAIDYIRKGWTKSTLAKDKDGKICYAKSPKAVCWCAIGALSAAYGNSREAYLKAHDKLVDVIGDNSVPDWNDAPERTHEEVIAAFEEAGI